MFVHGRTRVYSRAVRRKWFSLAFAAGTINVGGYLARHRFVTHVTGFATLFGIEVAKLDFRQAWPILTVPFFFLLGAMLSSFFVDTQLSRQRRARYSLVLVLVTSLLLLAAIGGTWNAFGPFGGAYDVAFDYPLLVLLCLASGMQNAVITTGSGMVVRTTHLTGLTTDLGVGLTRMLFGRLTRLQRWRETRYMLLRIGTILSFGMGGIVGAWLFTRFQYLGFLLPAVICLYLSWIAWRAQRGMDLRQLVPQGGHKSSIRADDRQVL